MTDDRACPDCGREAVAIVEVASIGSEEFDVQEGEVHLDRDGGYGSGWRLYCHQETDSS